MNVTCCARSCHCSRPLAFRELSSRLLAFFFFLALSLCARRSSSSSSSSSSFSPSFSSKSSESDLSLFLSSLAFVLVALGALDFLDVSSGALTICPSGTLTIWFRLFSSTPGGAAPSFEGDLTSFCLTERLVAFGGEDATEPCAGGRIGFWGEAGGFFLEAFSFSWTAAVVASVPSASACA